MFQPAGMHHPDLIGHEEGLQLIMGNQDGGNTLVAQDGAHFSRQLLAQLLVHAGEGLIQQHQGRARGNGPRQGDALLLPTGELVGIAAGIGPQAHQFQQLTDPRLASGRRLLADTERDVVGDGQVREQCKILEHHADLALLGCQAPARPTHDLATETDLALGDGFEARDGAQHRGLAAAAQPQQAADPSLFQVEGHVLHHRQVAVTDTNAVNLEERSGGVWFIHGRDVRG